MAMLVIAELVAVLVSSSLVLPASSAAATASASSAAAASTVRPRSQMHRTPFGVRAGGCTLEVPSHSRIDEVVRDGVAGVLVTRRRRLTAASAAAASSSSRVEVGQEEKGQDQEQEQEWEYEPESEAFFYPTPQHCHDDMAALLQRRHAMTGRGPSPPPPPSTPPYSGRPSKVWTPDNFTCKSLPCDGWIDNAGWEINGEGNPWPLTIKEFNATYILPPVPPQRRSPPNCTFNYTSTDSCPGISFFTGLENSDGWDRLCRKQHLNTYSMILTATLTGTLVHCRQS
jgi:hypothetical protein